MVPDERRGYFAYAQARIIADGCRSANVDFWLLRTTVVSGVVSIVIGSPSSGATDTAFPLIALIVPSTEKKP